MRSQEEADEYFEICVLHSMENFGKTREEAEKLERTNLGYYAGYYSQETSERVQRLFNCSHPIFGKVDEFPTPQEAFEMGMSGLTTRDYLHSKRELDHHGNMVKRMA